MKEDKIYPRRTLPVERTSRIVTYCGPYPEVVDMKGWTSADHWHHETVRTEDIRFLRELDLAIERCKEEE